LLGSLYGNRRERLAHGSNRRMLALPKPDALLLPAENPVNIAKR